MPSHQSPILGPSTYFAPYVNIATHLSQYASKWILNSSASHHITTNLGYLCLHYPYSGHDDVLIDDDNGLSISHI